MRITVSHNKGKEEATRIVDSATDIVLNSMFSGTLYMKNFQKQWNGSRLNFTVMAGRGIASIPVKGWILPTDTDVTIDCELPLFIEQLLPDCVRSNVQSAVRGLLK